VVRNREAIDRKIAFEHAPADPKLLDAGEIVRRRHLSEFGRVGRGGPRPGSGFPHQYPSLSRDRPDRLPSEGVRYRPGPSQHELILAIQPQHSRYGDGHFDQPRIPDGFHIRNDQSIGLASAGCSELSKAIYRYRLRERKAGRAVNANQKRCASQWHDQLITHHNLSDSSGSRSGALSRTASNFSRLPCLDVVCQDAQKWICVLSASASNKIAYKNPNIHKSFSGRL